MREGPCCLHLVEYKGFYQHANKEGVCRDRDVTRGEVGAGT